LTLSFRSELYHCFW